MGHKVYKSANSTRTSNLSQAARPNFFQRKRSLSILNPKPDQMFHILVQACLTEKQFKFGFNQKTVVFVLCLTL